VDPLTHALLGSGAAYLGVGRRLGRAAAAVGAMAALLPDADVLIRSAADPLLAIEHHRGFTHALLFVPVGGAVAALPWMVARGFRRRWRAVLGAATLGYATHGPLDAATTYGTQLFWPFSTYRVGLNWISILDPLFTLVLLLGLGAALWRGSGRPVAAALLACAVYLGIGVMQRERALSAQERIAASRGHVRERGDAFPTFANNLVWRSLYAVGDSLHADRIRVSWRGEAEWSPGPALPWLRVAEAPPDARASPRIERDFRRFAWFADGWVARAPVDPSVIGDARYTLEPGRYEPIWGVRFHPDSLPPTEWVNRTRDRRLEPRVLRDEIMGRDPAYRPVP
jgi:inner membrane protein